MRVVTVSGEPKPLHERAYRIAVKHRYRYMAIVNKTPWWQGRKLRRRYRGWERAMRAYHANGQDHVQEI